MSIQQDGRMWSRIAHDLRGPLMPLRTAAWLLRNELGESTRACELAEIVERQSTRLTRMMDELGDWGRSTDAQLALDCRAIDPMQALEMAIGAIPGCGIEPRCSPEARASQVQADQHRLARLLETVIEYSMHRAVDHAPEIEVSRQAGQLRICVLDRGAPLDAAAREALLSQPQDRPFDEGLGLRLLTARRIAEAHGGQLTAEPAPHGGLALVCLLPASETA